MLKTLEALAEHCLVCQPARHMAHEGHPAVTPATYLVFQRWVQAYRGEAFVVDFMRLAEISAKHIMDPEANAAPDLDYSA